MWSTTANLKNLLVILIGLLHRMVSYSVLEVFSFIFKLFLEFLNLNF